MRLETSTTWWEENSIGVWCQIHQLDTKKKIPELVISFFAESIKNEKDSTTVSMSLCINNYTTRKISIPTRLMRDNDGITLKRVSIKSDLYGVVNKDWSSGKFLFNKPLPKRSSIIINLTIDIKNNSSKEVKLTEEKMDEGSPTLFSSIRVIPSNEFEIVHRNQLLYTYHGSVNQKGVGIIKVGSFDTLHNQSRLLVKFSRIRIDIERSYIDNSRITLMTMNEDFPLHHYSEKRSYGLDSEGVEVETSFPVMFVGDNTEIETWWYVVSSTGQITIKSPKSITRRGTLSSSAVIMF